MADENSKSDVPAANPGADIPEVEAEIVDEGGVSSRDSAFADNDKTADEAGAGQEKQPVAKRMPFTPGVILFFGFAAFALAAFGMWRLQPQNSSAITPLPNAQEEQAPATEEARDENQNEIEADDSKDDPVPAPGLGDEAAGAADEQGTISAVTETEGDDPGKIDNNPISAAKKAQTDFNASPNLALEGDVFLPPLGSEKAAPTDKQSLQQAAKEAFRASEPKADAPPTENEGQQMLPTKEGELAFEVQTGDTGLAPNQSEANPWPLSTGDGTSAASENGQGRVAATDQAARAPGAFDENTKVLNQVATLKESFEAEKAQLNQALEAERQRNQEQGAEIEAMRRDFQSVLDARSEKANAEIQELRQRLDKIRNEEITPVARRVAGAVALRALESAFDQGAPFESELQQIEQTTAGAPAILILRRYAQEGVMSLPTLKAQFGLSSARRACRGRQRKRQWILGRVEGPGAKHHFSKARRTASREQRGRRHIPR